MTATIDEPRLSGQGPEEPNRQQTLSTPAWETYRVAKVVVGTVCGIVPGLILAILYTLRARAVQVSAKKYWIAFAIPAALWAVLIVVVGASPNPTAGQQPGITAPVTQQQSQGNAPASAQPAAPTNLGTLSGSDLSKWCNNFNETTGQQAVQSATSPTGWVCESFYEGQVYTSVNISQQDLNLACEVFAPGNVGLEANVNGSTVECTTG